MDAQQVGLRAILDTALDAVIVMDQDGIVRDWNARAERTFGWRREEAVGRLLTEMIVPVRYRDAHERGLAHFREHAEGPLLGKLVEIEGVCRDGREIPVELSIAAFPDTKRTLFLGFLRDITNRKLADLRTKQAATRAMLLHKAVVLASETESFDEALAGCIELVCEITGWPVGHAYLREDDQLVPSDIWRGDVQRYERLIDTSRRFRFARGEGLPGRIWESGEPLSLTDMSIENFPRGAAENGIEAAFGFPIRGAGDMIAVLEFFACDKSVPSPDTLLIVRSIGEQTGRVFERRLAERQSRAYADSLREVNEELDHRVKNLLTVIGSLATLSAQGAASINDFLAAFRSRLFALAETHALLAETKWASAPLADTARQVLSHYDVTIAEGPVVTLHSKRALTIGLLLNEMATNAVKYGALAQGGRVELSWTVAGDDVVLKWDEDGAKGIAAPSRIGFGTRLIRSSMNDEMGGSAEVRYEPTGVHWVLTFPSAG